MSYFYLDRYNKQCGPIDPKDFRSYGVNVNTLVWCEGMVNWTPAGQVPELAGYFNVAPKPPTNFGGNNNYGGNNYGNNNYGGNNYGGNNYGNNNYGGNNVAPAKPDNGLVWAILSTLFCCLPVGIYSIILAAKVDGLYNSGNYAEAQKTADDAKKWAGISAVLGLVAIIFYIISGAADA